MAQGDSPTGRSRFLGVALTTLACAALLSACRQNPAAAKIAHFDAGNRYFDQKKFDEAVIEYRNAVKYDTKFGEARFKLGQARQFEYKFRCGRSHGHKSIAQWRNDDKQFAAHRAIAER